MGKNILSSLQTMEWNMDSYIQYVHCRIFLQAVDILICLLTASAWLWGKEPYFSQMLTSSAMSRHCTGSAWHCTLLVLLPTMWHRTVLPYDQISLLYPVSILPLSHPTITSYQENGALHSWKPWGISICEYSLGNTIWKVVSFHGNIWTIVINYWFPQHVKVPKLRGVCK